MTKKMQVTRRNLFLQLLGVFGTGLLIPKAFTLMGWKKIDGPGKNAFERIVATKQGWNIIGTRSEAEYIIQTVEMIWYCEGWEHVCFDRALSTHCQTLGKVPVYIGSPKDAKYLVVERGICALEPRVDGPGLICSIGFCPNDGKWYGWSHRAICGFGGGDKTWEQAKVAASRFAESVG